MGNNKYDVPETDLYAGKLDGTKFVSREDWDNFRKDFPGTLRAAWPGSNQQVVDEPISEAAVGYWVEYEYIVDMGTNDIAPKVLELSERIYDEEEGSFRDVDEVTFTIDLD